MTDEERKIVFNAQAEHTPSKAVALGTMSDSSHTQMDVIMEALQSISSQNKGIKLKLSERFENLGTRVNNQTAQMESQLKLHGDKLAAK